MVVNKHQKEHVKFVSYSGKWPNLCSGVLTLKIEGTEYRFGHNYHDKNWETDGNFERFWESGGSCSIKHIETDEWIVDGNDLPE